MSPLCKTSPLRSTPNTPTTLVAQPNPQRRPVGVQHERWSTLRLCRTSRERAAAAEASAVAAPCCCGSVNAWRTTSCCSRSARAAMAASTRCGRGRWACRRWAQVVRDTLRPVGLRQRAAAPRSQVPMGGVPRIEVPSACFTGATPACALTTPGRHATTWTMSCTC